MRLVGIVNTEKEAYAFSSFLAKEKIPNVYEPFVDAEHRKRYRIWVEEEDNFDAAIQLFRRFEEHPQEFQVPEVPPLQDKDIRQAPLLRPPRLAFYGLTKAIVLICSILFLWNNVQRDRILRQEGAFAYQVGFTPVQKNLIFDFPYAFEALQQLLKTYPLANFKEVNSLPVEVQTQFQQVEHIPSWKGIIPFIESVKKEGWAEASKVPLFEKIGQGQMWRLFTPALLHSDFLHILFNMAWAWMLGKQIEARLSRPKLLFFILLVGVLCNVAQYLMTGPYFVGFSGILVGMVGFIWMRQRLAPWEGYPLNRGTILFFLLFVLAMCALEFIAFILRTLSWVHLELHIANTAHVVGGLLGLALGRLKWFARSVR